MAAENVVFLIVAVSAFTVGAFIYVKPQKAFDIQKAFYRLINWNIEPISWDKEIRNTKAMGMILVVFVIVSCFYKLTH